MIRVMTSAIGSAPEDSRERDHPAYRALRHAGVYSLVQRVAGAHRVHRVLVDELVRPADGMTVIDVGAGTGMTRDLLPQCSYIAVEPNADYAKEMRNRFANDPDVIVIEDTCEALKSLRVAADRILFIGVLHHLSDDAARSALSDAAALLAPGGSVVCLDPCLYPGQPLLARLLVRRDRGENVRQAQEYAALATRSFGRVRMAITDGLLTLPWSHCWLECSAPSALRVDDR